MRSIHTNVLVYLFDDRDVARQAKAVEVVSSLTDGVLLWQVATEFVAAMRKVLPQDRYPAAAWQQLEQVRSGLSLALPSPRTLELARGLTDSHQLQFWDAMIYAACLDAGVTRLYSEDLPARPIEGLEVVNPFAT